MRRIAQQLGFFFFLYVLVGIVRFPYAVLPDLIPKYANDAFSEHPARLSIGSTAVSFPLTVTVSQLSSQFPTTLGPFELALQNLQCSLSIPALFTFAVKTNCNVSLYEGAVRSVVSRSFFSEQLHIDSEASQVNISQTPLLAAHAVEGLVDVRWKGEVAPSSSFAEGVFEASVTEGAYRGQHKLFGLLTLPILDSVRAQLKGSIKGSTISATIDELSTSLGSASGIATGTLQGGKFKQYSAQIELHLLPEGVRVFGPYLSLGAKGQGKPDDTSWSIIVEKKENQNFPVVTTSAI